MDDVSLFLLLVAGGIVLWLVVRVSSLSNDLRNARGDVNRFQTEVNRLSSRIQQEAIAQFNAWRAKEYENVKREQSELAIREATTQLEQWKVALEASIRDDAIQRSRSVTVGKVAEHFIPYLPDFQYNPKDARFIGSPVDFVVFDGLDDGQLREVAFVEIKSGAGTLTTRERQIRDAVKNGSVRWREVRIVTPSSESVSIQVSDGTSRSPDETKERLIRDYIRLGIPEDVARNQVEGLPTSHTRAIRAICDSCRQVITVTLHRGQDTTSCPECGRSMKFNVDWNVST